MDLFIIAALAGLGWLSGCLINYMADVLPQSRRLSPALCDGCGCPRPWTAYLLMRSCSSCHKRRSMRAWAVQVLAMAVTIAQWYHPSPRLGFWLGVVLVTYAGVVAVIDIENRLILHPVSVVGAVLCAPMGLWLHGPVSTLIGALAGFGMMMACYLLGGLMAKGLGKLRGQTIDEEALGFGDVILGTVLGLILGWPGIGVGVFYTIFIAGAGSLLIIFWQLIRRRYEAYTAVAFGPYMLAAALLLLFMPK